MRCLASGISEYVPFRVSMGRFFCIKIKTHMEACQTRVYVVPDGVSCQFYGFCYASSLIST